MIAGGGGREKSDKLWFKQGENAQTFIWNWYNTRTADDTFAQGKSILIIYTFLVGLLVDTLDLVI